MWNLFNCAFSTRSIHKISTKIKTNLFWCGAMHLSVCSSHLNQFIGLQGPPPESAAQISEGASCWFCLSSSITDKVPQSCSHFCHFRETLRRSILTKNTQNWCKLQYSNFSWKIKSILTHNYILLNILNGSLKRVQLCSLCYEWGFFMDIVFIWISVLDISMKQTSFQLLIFLILHWFIVFIGTLIF